VSSVGIWRTHFVTLTFLPTKILVVTVILLEQQVTGQSQADPYASDLFTLLYHFEIISTTGQHTYFFFSREISESTHVGGSITSKQIRSTS
jgi:hypothetical protein